MRYFKFVSMYLCPTEYELIIHTDKSLYFISYALLNENEI